MQVLAGGEPVEKKKADAGPHPDTAAERRLVTVVFCDLVGSTRIAEQLEPEDQSWFSIKYESLCHSSMTAYGGYVERFEGDGMVACFGYPHALENGAQRSVSAALDLIDAIQSANWSSLTSHPVKSRIGIDTGVVLSTDLHTDDGLAKLSTLHGITLNIAKRLQEFAAPDSILITDSTLAQVTEQFDVETLGKLDSSDLSNPPIVHRVDRAKPIAQQINRVHRGELPPLAGRAEEMQVLLRGWSMAQLQRGSTVCISGEPGIGKSRLMAELRLAATVEDDASVIELQCSPYHKNSSYFPAVEALNRELGVASANETDRFALLERKLRERGTGADETVALLANLLSIAQPATNGKPALSPEAAKKRTIGALSDVLIAPANRRPLLLIIEDVQWIDPSTLDVLLNLAVQIKQRKVPVLMAMSARPEFEALDSGFPQDIDSIALEPLSDSDTERLVYHAGRGRVWPREILRHIVSNAAGFPLFAEEMAKSLLRSDRIIDRSTHFEARDWSPELHVPPTLHDLLRSRLDESGQSRIVAQRASVLGKAFTRKQLTAICTGDINDVDLHLGKLISEGLMESSADGEDLAFRHALIQRASYESLSRDALKDLHRRVARILAEEDDRTPATRPELAAQHFSLGEMPDRAVPLWLQAAASSIHRSANLEAIAQAESGLRAIADLGSPSVLKEAELFLNTTKGMALIATRGWSVPEVGETFARAEGISKALEGNTHTAALWGLWVYHLMRGDLAGAEDYAGQILNIGEATGESQVLIEGYWTLGNTCFWQQRIDDAEQLLLKAIRLYDPAVHSKNAFIYGQDPGVSALVYLTFVNSYRGRIGKALEYGKQALDRAEEADHPFSTAWARGANTMLRIELNDVAGAMTSGEETLQYAMEQEQVFWIAAMQMAVGWARLRSGDRSGIDLAEQGIVTYQATGMRIALGFFYTLIADCHLTAGSVDTASEWVAKGLEVAADDLMYLPGLLLIRGAVHSQRGQLKAAETDFREALRLCSEKGARLRELHAASALAQLLHATGDTAGAIDTLRPIVSSLQKDGGEMIAEPAAQLLSSFET